MSKKRRVPAYGHHKPTGQARVRINGTDHYLGPYGSPESHERYEELIAEYLANGAEPSTAKTLTAVLAAWWVECKQRYTKGKGKLGGAQNWRPLIRLLREAHGDERADDLGPVKLRKLLESEAHKQDWSLCYTKMQLARVKLIYEWAVSEELVKVTTLQTLKTVKLRNGRKSKPLPPVDDSLVDRTLPYLSPMVADMCRIQRLCGCRPGELVIMRPEDVDRSGDVWVYQPSTHKTEHHGKSRTIYIGPKAQAILAPWLMKADGYVFATRRSERYTTDSYRRHIQRTCEEHGIERWSPQQIRKRAATNIRAALDVEHAASILGHSSATVTGQHYAANDRNRAIEAARRLG